MLNFKRNMGEINIRCSLPRLRFGAVFLFTYIATVYGEPLPLAAFHGDPHFLGADDINFDFTGKPGHSY